MAEGHGGRGLEEGKTLLVSAACRHLLDLFMNQSGQAGNLPGRDFFRVHQDSLLETNQVRRSVQADAQARSPQNGCQEGRGGTLSVGAGHQDRGKSILGIFQLGKESGDGDCSHPRAQALKAEEEFEALEVIHSGSCGV